MSDKRKATPKTKKNMDPADVMELNKLDLIDLSELRAALASIEGLIESLGKSTELDQARARLAEATMWIINHITRKAVGKLHNQEPTSVFAAVVQLADARARNMAEELASLQDESEARIQATVDGALAELLPIAIEELEESHLPAVLLDEDGGVISMVAEFPLEEEEKTLALWAFPLTRIRAPKGD